MNLLKRKEDGYHKRSVRVDMLSQMEMKAGKSIHKTISVCQTIWIQDLD